MSARRSILLGLLGGITGTLLVLGLVAIFGLWPAPTAVVRVETATGSPPPRPSWPSAPRRRW